MKNLLLLTSEGVLCIVCQHHTLVPIDIEDLDLVYCIKGSWTTVRYTNNVHTYVRSSKGQLHRLLVNAGKGQIVDHINGDFARLNKEDL